MMFFYQLPEELAIPLAIGISVFLTICKFTYFPHFSWAFCLFPIWLPLLLTVIVLVGMVIWTILQSIFYKWFWKEERLMNYIICFIQKHPIYFYLFSAIVGVIWGEVFFRIRRNDWCFGMMCDLFLGWQYYHL